MANKIIITILILLVVVTGGTGYYAYTLSLQIEALSERLAASESAQNARAGAIIDEINTLSAETGSRLGTLESNAAETGDEIDTLESRLGSTQQHITALEEDISSVTADIGQFEEQLDEAVAGFSRAMIDASGVYNKINQATVRINDGQSTIGSGFIYHSSSHVLTANHVIESMSRIYIILHDGRVIEATVVGASELSDIAVLELAEDPGIAPLPLADSGQLLIGEPVVALGSPGTDSTPSELRDTLSTGVVSQVNRFVNIEGRSTANLIQSDVAVNPGNSGCPLANADGEIIGVVIARINADIGDGISYAVASNKVERVAMAILDQGFFDYPWIGIGVTDITPLMVRDLDLPDADGVLVTEVTGGGPADMAGIEADDIVLAIDGETARNTADLTSYLGEFKSPGDPALFSVRRGNVIMEFEIAVGKRE